MMEGWRSQLIIRLVATMLLIAVYSKRAGAFVHATDCPLFDLHAITQLVIIELQTSGQFINRVDGMRVNLTCEPGTDYVNIEVWDPITEKKMQRTISANTRDGADRMLALAIAQLYKASWSELLLKTPSPKNSNAPSVDVAAAEAVARNTFRPGDEEKEWMAAIGAGARRLSLPNGFPVFHSQLSIGKNFKKRWFPGLYLGFDTGEADVVLGAVRFFNLSLGAECAVRFNPSARVVFDLGTSLGGTWSHLTAQVDFPGLTGSATSGFSGEATLFTGPGLRLRDLLLRLQIEGGYTIKNPIVGVGDRDKFTLGGYFIGISLRIFYAFSKKQMR
ncbi:MAG: hypothetical protein JXX14_18160 [Deltaproteobacteria bacterium]|nr:hypothetical protein [Deltaproteobacteria bacterium]